MQNATEYEYKVLMTHSATAKPQGGERWQATLLDFPNIVEEAFSRDQVIHQIKKRIVDFLSQAEIITLYAPAFPVETNGTTDELIAQGWDDHGLFKNDSEALQIFDEIERERDNHLVGGA